MILLIIGGSGSGKSEYAESRCLALQTLPRTYIATMQPFDDEGKSRVIRHRKMRAGKGFDTLECYTDLDRAPIPADGTVLLECMSNLAANEMFEPDRAARNEEDADAAAQRILRGVQHLTATARHTIIVTNQVFSDGIRYDPDTERYLKTLAQINAGIAAMADEVVEVVCGIPLHCKGAESQI